MFDFLATQKGQKTASPQKAKFAYNKISSSKLTPLLCVEAFNAPILLESAHLQAGAGRFSIVVLNEAFRIEKKNDKIELLECGIESSDSAPNLAKNFNRFNLNDIDFKSIESNMNLAKKAQKDSIKSAKNADFLEILDFFRKLAPNTIESENQNSQKLPHELPLPLGGVGFLGYEFFSEIENKIIFKKPALADIPQCSFVFGRDFVIIDHFFESAFVLSIGYLGELNEVSCEARVEQISQKLQNIRDFSSAQTNAKHESRVISEDKHDYYCKMVSELKKRIYAGDLLQCVPSQSMQIATSLSPLLAYTRLRAGNPSPYMYYFNFKDFAIIGASPEVLVKVESFVSENVDSISANKRKITLRPIAGTRARGQSAAEDLRLESELKADPKENAEHLMLLDLGRNDVGKVALAGSVRLNAEKIVEKYSRVIHLVSEVCGILDEDHFSPKDALKAAFPAGTVSGAPKIAAIATIEELENHSRGIYAGAVGYFAANGDMNFCIAIRTALWQSKEHFTKSYEKLDSIKNLIKEPNLAQNEGVYTLQAGGGIVIDSQEEAEFIETQNKMRALKDAILN